MSNLQRHSRYTIKWITCEQTYDFAITVQSISRLQRRSIQETLNILGNYIESINAKHQNVKLFIQHHCNCLRNDVDVTTESNIIQLNKYKDEKFDENTRKGASKMSTEQTTTFKNLMNLLMVRNQRIRNGWIILKK